VALTPKLLALAFALKPENLTLALIATQGIARGAGGAFCLVALLT